MTRDRKNDHPGRFVGSLALPVAFFLILTPACGRSDGSAERLPSDTTLTVGFGLTTGQNRQAGIQQAVDIVVLEELVLFGPDGRPHPRLAEKWSVSPDGLTWRLWLRPGVMLHDGQPLTATLVRETLERDLPAQLGPAFDDLEGIRAVADREIEFSLTRPSAFLLEGLRILIDGPGESPIGTGPFYATHRSNGEVLMEANKGYYGGEPDIDRVIFKPYASVRAAWADMLRGSVDMVYEVGTDALDLLEPSSGSRVFSFQRPYAYVLILNVRKEHLRHAIVRRALNEAIDRETLITQALKGHARPADGSVWPDHWAYDPTLPRFRYQPSAISDTTAGLRFTCLYSDPSYERMALVLQRQLQAIGVDITLELVPIDQVFGRLQTGDFDAVLADMGLGPTLLRPYLFWHSQGPYNWGGFANSRVDSALDGIRHAPDDAAYKAGVAAFQRAIVEDPPGIFLAWSERARAVSTRFEVQAEPGRDIWNSLRLWRPTVDRRKTAEN